MSELKPCPFCKGKAFVAVHERINGLGREDYSGHTMCCICKASVLSDGFMLTPEQAIESATRKWNRRANDGQSGA